MMQNMELCGTCLFFMVVTTVAGQFLDFPQFSSLFPATNNQRIPSHSQQTSKRTDFYNVHTELNSEKPQQNQRKTIKTPNSSNEARNSNIRTTSNAPAKRISTSTKQGLNFGSFVDVSPSEGQFFRGQNNPSSSSQTTKKPTFENSSFDNSRTTKNSYVKPQTTDNTKPFSNERPNYDDYPYDKTTKRPILSRPQTYDRPNDYDPYYQNYASTTKKPNLNRPQQSDIVYERPFSRPNEYENERPNNVDYNSRPDYERPNTFERPGVLRPNVDENRAPITNRPPYVGGNTAQSGTGDFVFPSNDDAPQLMSGPNEDLMSEEQKRRAIQTSERMCERYKALNTQHLSAIPLIPSPSPVTVDFANCTPLNVPLVVGGQVVTIEQHPHMAALGWKKIQGRAYSWKCGGSLLSNQFVLTAAHCASQDRDNTVVSGPPSVVQLGSDRLDDPSATVVSVAAAIRHPKYKAPASYHDIALLKLATIVSFSDHIRPACLGDPPRTGEAIIATGWGRTEFGGDTSQVLRGVSLPVWDINECSRALGTSRKLPQGPSRDSQICAGELQGGKDTCQGDSGGPAQVADSCLWRVVGVTSLGRACGAARTPALYARAARAFIASVVWPY